MTNSSLTTGVAGEQLARMRGMTALYHRQFFSDVRFVLIAFLALFVVGWSGIEEAFLLIPFVALWGACQTAFDASYLIFARQYAAALEGWLNDRLEEPILVASQIEDAYLFPMSRRKIVTIPIGGPVTWFGFMTAFITAGGVVAALAGLWAGGEVLESLTLGPRLAYLVTLAVLAGAAVAVGAWWFVGGAGERKIRAVLTATFGR